VNVAAAIAVLAEHPDEAVRTAGAVLLRALGCDAGDHAARIVTACCVKPVCRRRDWLDHWRDIVRRYGRVPGCSIGARMSKAQPRGAFGMR